jgi:5,6-dimethylbenzimidazole synthase
MMPTYTHAGEDQHGGIDWNELKSRGIDPRSVVDLSSNLLSVDHPTSVRHAIETAAISRYPDRDCGLLCQALARRCEISSDRILAGNGCSELIHLVASTLLQCGTCGTHRTLVIGPTFSEYSRASRLANAEVNEIRSVAADGFAVPVEAIELELGRRNYRVAWICNPNNPTGRSIDASVIRQWIQTYPQTTFVVDESYIEFSSSTQSLIADDSPNLIVLRSMTKSYALAGLRLGYLVAAASQVESLIARRVPWSVNGIAQAAGLAVLQSQSHFDDAMSEMRTQRQRLIREFRDRGYRPLKTEAGFILIPVENAASFRDRLLSGGVVVRDCHSFGIENHVRIAVGDRAANDRLFSVLDEREVSSASIASTDHGYDPTWKSEFRSQLYDLFRMRRDVRRFHTTAIAPDALARWIDAACMAPSVGLSQPWRFISVNQPSIRNEVVVEFETQNALAASTYDDSTRHRYEQLKLSGLREAPEHLAIFIEPSPEQGRGLGRRTMPETVAYSVVAAIQNFWLAARCEGVGVGWVSIIRPKRIGELLEVPRHWQLIAYLCVGYPAEPAHEIPELERLGWQRRLQANEQWTQS